jgi:hypothetical protein
VSPPKKEGRRLAPTAQKLINGSDPNVANGTASSNRQLLERSGTVRLWAITQGRRTVYEVESGETCWAFNLLFPALGKFDRLARQRRPA